MKQQETWKPGNGLIFAALSGSHLYGTNTPESDTDIRGVCYPPVSTMLGVHGFEQYQFKNKELVGDAFGVESDDVTIYSLEKFFKLCLDCNPNIVELLFTPGNCVLYTTPEWKSIIANRDMFLSTRAVHTFSGYAYSQLERIKRHKKWLDDPPEEPLQKDYGASFVDGAWAWPDVNANAVMEIVYYSSDRRREIGELFNLGARKSEYERARQVWQNYQQWRKNRNKKRSHLEREFGYDTKHAMHLYRLSLEANELLVDGKITLPFTGEQRELLLSVLRGGLGYNIVVKYAERLHELMRELEGKSVLPKFPDRDGADKLLIEMQLEWILQNTV